MSTLTIGILIAIAIAVIIIINKIDITNSKLKKLERDNEDTKTKIKLLDKQMLGLIEMEMNASIEKAQHSLTESTVMYNYYSQKSKSPRKCGYCGSPYAKEHGETCVHCGAYLPEENISDSYFRDGGVSIRPYYAVWSHK